MNNSLIVLNNLKWVSKMVAIVTYQWMKCPRPLNKTIWKNFFLVNKE